MSFVRYKIRINIQINTDKKLNINFLAGVGGLSPIKKAANRTVIIDNGLQQDTFVRTMPPKSVAPKKQSDFNVQAAVDELYRFVLQPSQDGVVGYAIEGKDIHKNAGVHLHLGEERIDKASVLFLDFGEVIRAMGITLYRG